MSRALLLAAIGPVSIRGFAAERSHPSQEVRCFVTVAVCASLQEMFSLIRSQIFLSQYV